MKHRTHWIRLTAIVVILLSFMQRCKHERDDLPEPGNTDTTDTVITPIVKSDTCSFDTVYFVNDILPIFVSKCGGSLCHSQGATNEEDVFLYDYDQIMEHGKIKPFKPDDNEIIEVVTETDPEKLMPPPPAAPLTPEEINAIKVWINQGALNNACENKCDTSDVRFSNEVGPIILATCQGCHQGQFPGGGVYVRNYPDIKVLANSGALIGTIFHKPGYKPMPQGGQLDSCSLAKVRIWVDNGAKND